MHFTALFSNCICISPIEFSIWSNVTETWSSSHQSCSRNVSALSTTVIWTSTDRRGGTRSEPVTNGNAECGKPRLNNRISSRAATIMPTGPERDPCLCILNTLRALLLSLTLSLYLKDTLGLTFTWCYTHSESRCSNTLPSIVIWHCTEIHNSFYLKVFHKNIMVILWYIYQYRTRWYCICI